MMSEAIYRLETAVLEYREAEGMADAMESVIERLAVAAEAVLDSWDFDRGIPILH